MISAEDNAPRVIACTPTYNAAEFITPTLESLAAQSYPNLRILVSDDASDDDTLHICERFAAKDTRFSVIRQPQRLGWIGNANALLQAAASQADYLLFAFHDDILKPDFVSKLVDRLEARPQAIVAYSDVECHYLDGSLELRVYDRLDGLTSPVDRAKTMLRQHRHWAVPNRGVFRAWAASQIGGLKRNLAGEFSADWPWLVHMSLLGEFTRVPEVLCDKYYKENSVSRGWNFNSWHRIAAALACGREIRNSDLSGADKLTLHYIIARRAIRLLRVAHRWQVTPRT